ncbi:hypothetical protein [Acidihalobacter aeolianus]|uniref:hypothetical protein n=1 Tax=Acidihalobacter aeolianus TaxID=2792603 RepID=UPI0012EA456B|nr:hypothetical protein [Acidihalobacter aeolianus]
MIDPVIISIVALCISIAGFGFSIYQWKKNSFIKSAEKAHEVTLEAFELRRSSQDLRDLIAVTDDIDDMEGFLRAIDKVSEELLNALRNPRISLVDAYKAQQKISDLRLELDLLHKQVLEVKRLNNEVAEHERSKNNR